MIDICPTVTAADVRTYHVQMEQVAGFTTRIHIDVSDGKFTPNKLVDFDQVWWPAGMQADIHVMYREPFGHLEALLSLKPQLVIVHAEAEGDFLKFAEALHAHNIETGVALLAETPVETIVPALEHIDHVLIFSGDLGHFGGHANLRLLEKVGQLKALKPRLEIGWDGGVSDKNVRDLVNGGVEVINAGGFIHGAQDPEAAYATLKTLVEQKV